MSKQTIKVSNTADLRTAIEAGYTKDQIEIEQPDHSAALSAARAEGHAAGVAEANASAVDANKTAVDNAAKAERTRLTELAAIAEPGFEAEYKAAVEGSHTPEQFALAQMKSAKDRGITLGAIRKDSKGAPHANAPAEAAAAAEAKAGWDKVAAKYAPKKATA
jgi:hypothetical protein